MQKIMGLSLVLIGGLLMLREIAFSIYYDEDPGQFNFSSYCHHRWDHLLLCLFPNKIKILGKPARV